MHHLKKLITFKLIAILVAIFGLMVLIIGIISAATGVALGYGEAVKQSAEYVGSSSVINNQLYAERYRSILNKYMMNNGYVSLERLVFYLQRTNNILDITTLSQEEWEKAYLANLKDKQLIPLKTMCKTLKFDENLPEYDVEDGENENGVLIEALNLCVVDGLDVSVSDNYNEVTTYKYFTFPLKTNFTITSYVSEQRSVKLSDSKVLVDSHSGWDLAVPIGTEFYSVCDGRIKNIVNTQNNDLAFKESQNEVGNYVEVECNNGLVASYYHIKYNSVPYAISRKGAMVKAGQKLGLTSTTGRSSGPHLHVGLKSAKGDILDVMEYINFNYNDDKRSDIYVRN